MKDIVHFLANIYKLNKAHFLLLQNYEVQSLPPVNNDDLVHHHCTDWDCV